MPRRSHFGNTTIIPMELRTAFPFSPEPWTRQASCVGETELFDADPGTELAARAMEVCGGCPVAAQCLSGALERGEEYGIWGGQHFTPRERRMCRRGLHDMESCGVIRPPKGSQPPKTYCRECQRSYDAARRARKRAEPDSENSTRMAA